MGKGSDNLFELCKHDKRRSIGGYFQDRLPSHFSIPNLNCDGYLCKPIVYNDFIPENIDLLAGDPLVELQSNLMAINNDIKAIIEKNPEIFSFKNLKDGIVDIRDFQTTGVVAFAGGKPFSKVKVGKHSILKNDTQIKDEYLQHCKDAIDDLVDKL